MKRALALILTAVLALTAASCNSSADTPTTGDTLDEIEYVIYSSATDGADELTADTAALPNNVIFKDSSEIDFSLAPQTSVTNENASEAKTVTVNGSNYSVPLVQSYSTALANCDIAELQAFALIDQYVLPDSIIAEYRHNSGELLFYLDLKATAGSGDITPDNATTIASNFIASLYGDTVMAQYTHVRTTDPDGTFIYVNYVRTIHGYPTSDTIRVKLTRNGEIAMINATQMGIFQPIENEITLNRIRAAEAVLRSSVPTAWTFEEDTKTLVIGSDGKCYLEIISLRNSQDDNEMESTTNKLHINVN